MRGGGAAFVSVPRRARAAGCMCAHAQGIAVFLGASALSAPHTPGALPGPLPPSPVTLFRAAAKQSRFSRPIHQLCRFSLFACSLACSLACRALRPLGRRPAVTVRGPTRRARTRSRPPAGLADRGGRAHRLTPIVATATRGDLSRGPSSTTIPALPLPPPCIALIVEAARPRLAQAEEAGKPVRETRPAAPPAACCPGPQLSNHTKLTKGGRERREAWPPQGALAQPGTSAAPPRRPVGALQCDARIGLPSHLVTRYIRSVPCRVSARTAWTSTQAAAVAFAAKSSRALQSTESQRPFAAPAPHGSVTAAQPAA